MKGRTNEETNDQKQKLKKERRSRITGKSGKRGVRSQDTTWNL